MKCLHPRWTSLNSVVYRSISTISYIEHINSAALATRRPITLMHILAPDSLSHFPPYETAVDPTVDYITLLDFCSQIGAAIKARSCHFRHCSPTLRSSIYQDWVVVHLDAIDLSKQPFPLHMRVYTVKSNVDRIGPLWRRTPIPFRQLHGPGVIPRHA
jgi:hypothetical protein